MMETADTHLRCDIANRYEWINETSRWVCGLGIAPSTRGRGPTTRSHDKNGPGFSWMPSPGGRTKKSITGDKKGMSVKGKEGGFPIKRVSFEVPTRTPDHRRSGEAAAKNGRARPWCSARWMEKVVYPGPGSEWRTQSFGSLRQG